MENATWKWTGPFLALFGLMNDDKPEKSTEEQNIKIDAIVGDETLGYEGLPPGEHSGQNAPRESGDLADGLADNRPEQMPKR